MNALINVTELVDGLATRDLHENYKEEFGSIDQMYFEKDGMNVLTEVAQKLYDELHDKWETIVMLSEVETQTRPDETVDTPSKMKHAISWFNNRSIPVHYDKISAELYVIEGDEIHIQVSSSEISYRAELWKNEVGI